MISVEDMFVLRLKALVMIQELCLQREYNDLILCNSELSMLFDDIMS